MPTYVTLFNYSAEGFKELSEERRQEQVRLIESQGGRVIGAYGLMGSGTSCLLPNSRMKKAPCARFSTPGSPSTWECPSATTR